MQQICLICILRCRYAVFLIQSERVNASNVSPHKSTIKVAAHVILISQSNNFFITTFRGFSR